MTATAEQLASGVQSRAGTGFRRRRYLKRVAIYLLMIAVVAIYIIPTFWVISTTWDTRPSGSMRGAVCMV